MAGQVVLPLTLNSERNFEAFFSGLEDPMVRQGLKAQPGTPQAIVQLADMVEDPTFLRMASEIANHLNSYRPAVPTTFSLTAPTHPTVPSPDIQAEGQKLRDYIVEQYPEALTLLKGYGQLAYPRLMAGGPNAFGPIAANAAAVVNAAVWANVAVATQAVVAAAAVVAIAVVVV